MPRPRAKEPRQKLTLTVDRQTMRVIRRIVKTVPEIEGPSAAVRYLARHYARRPLAEDLTQR